MHVMKVSYSATTPKAIGSFPTPQCPVGLCKVGSPWKQRRLGIGNSPGL